MKKLTHEEYVNRLNQSEFNIEPLETYMGQSVKILHHCIKHDINFYAKPQLADKHITCPQCIKEHKAKTHTKTHDEYINELKIIHPNIIPLETYINSATKILHKCLKHNVEWSTTPNHLFKSCGCPQCRRESYASKAAKTNEKYLEEVKIINNTILPLETYINEKTKILHRCLLCGYEWKTIPDRILRGHGCPKCNCNVSKTSEEYFDLVKINNPNIEILEEYNSSNKKILCKCKKHEYIWKAYAPNILKGGGCPLCRVEKVSEKRTKPHQQFILEAKRSNPNIAILDTYCGTKNKIKVKCLQCNHEWMAYPEDILHGHGCAICNNSIGENKIRQWLILKNITYIPQKKFKDCKDCNLLPFDFYLPDKNKCIEYDGIQHFEPVNYFGGQKAFKIRQQHDQIKDKYCEENNIPLLRIPYYANVEEELENFLFN